MKDPSFINRLIEHYALERLPVEGVLFKQTYRAAEMIDPCGLPARYRGEKPYGTCVIGLLTSDADSFSSMHRLLTDEIWHFYMGDPIEMLLLHENGVAERRVLGHDIFHGQLLQTVAPRGVWMGARLLQGGVYALFGNTMAPGFTSPDFESGDRDALIAQYPAARDLITALTRPGDHARFMPDGY